MNKETVPRVTVGMPVYNGEKFIKYAIESILNQTFTDLELIISDNASTDSTEEICKFFAAKDARIRYYRNASNIGLFKNYDRLVDLARGEYFIWHPYDDVRAPEFLRNAVEFLDNNPSFVLCFAKESKINEHGEVTSHLDFSSELDSTSIPKRVRDVLLVPTTISTEALIRCDDLKKTPLNLEFIGSDWNLALALALRGRFFEIPERMFFRRSHPGSSMKLYTKHERMWFSNPSKAMEISFPTWRLSYEYFKSVFRAPISLKDKFSSCSLLFSWLKRKRTRIDLIKDLRMAAKKVILTSKLGEKIIHAYQFKKINKVL